MLCIALRVFLGFFNDFFTADFSFDLTGKVSGSNNSSPWAFDSHWMCRTALHCIPSSNRCEYFPLSWFNKSEFWIGCVLLEASPCKKSSSFYLKFAQLFTIGTLVGDNHLCAFLMFSAGCFGIQQIGVHVHAC